MIQFIHRHAFTLQLCSLVAIVFLFGINFTKEVIPGYVLFALSIPLALLSILCFFEFSYRTVINWRNTSDLNKVFNIGKFIVSVYTVYMQVMCVGAFSVF